MARDTFMVSYLKRFSLWTVERLLDHHWIGLGFYAALFVGTAWFAGSHLGREFMPELEEGNLWIRGTFPLNMSLERVAADSARAREIIYSYAEIESVVPMIGRPDDGTDP